MSEEWFQIKMDLQWGYIKFRLNNRIINGEIFEVNRILSELIERILHTEDRLLDEVMNFKSEIDGKY